MNHRANRTRSVLRQKIAKARSDYLRKHECAPTALYIGREDFYDLIVELEAWELPQADSSGERSFMGMRIFRVNRPHHLDVSIPQV